MSVRDTAGDAEGGVGLAELTEWIARLAPGEPLVIAEFGAIQVTRWEVRRDRCGTPRVTYDSMSWEELSRGDTLSEPELTGFLRSGDGTSLLLTRGGEILDSLDISRRALHMVRARHEHARLLALGAAASVDEQLGEATANVPLSQWYELVLLGRDQSGRLSLTAQQIFEPGAKRLETQTFRIHCEPSSPAGTTFAVVARDRLRTSGLVSMVSAKLPPGRYTVNATLRRPGSVSFQGLPVPLRADARKLADVLATVPARVGEFGPTHLIVAVETCGPQDQVAAHLDRVGQLIRNVATGAEGSVRFSLLVYGAHPHDLRIDDYPVEVVAWAAGDQAVLAHLPMVAEHARARQDRYTRAGNIECMLERAASLLQGKQDTRPVLVTVGSRLAFPAWGDQPTEILPCPSHHDWRTYLQYLKEDHPAMAFGAICGGDRDAEVWRLLGADASAELVALDAWQFAADLRLLRPAAEHVPFPMVDR